MNKVLGIDIGGTFTRYGLVINEKVSNVEKLLTVDIQDFTKFIVDLIHEHNEIDVISIGIPGIVKNDEIISVPNIKRLEVPNFVASLKDITNIEVIINKDVNLLFINDVSRLNLSHKSNILAFYLGTGLGNTIRINNQIFKGNNGFSGELGHIPIIGNEQLCGCGKKGCSETIVSGKALLKLYKHYINYGEFRDLFTNHNEDTHVKTFIANFAKIIAIEMNILDITTLIIGGGVVNMPDFPQKKLVDLIRMELRSVSLETELEVFFVDDNPNSGINGAMLIGKEVKI